MGKRIISQARGHGSLTYRARRAAYHIRLNYPNVNEGTGKVLKLISDSGHSAPIAKIIMNNKVFYVPAAKNVFEGKKIEINGKIEDGNISELKKIPIGKRIFNIEIRPGDGGKLVRASGNSAEILSKEKEKVKILLSSKKELELDPRCRAIIGEAAGAGRLEKPILRAGKMWHMMRAKGKLWPRTSAVKVNIVDHPFGGGRGKRIKSKIAKRNAPPGARVGHIRPRRTGKRK